MAADPQDLCTVADVKAARRDELSVLDELYQEMVTDASSQMMEYANRRIRPLDTEPTARTFESLGAGRDVWVFDLSAIPASVEVLDDAGALQSTLTVASDVVALPRNRKPWEPIERIRFRSSAATAGPGQEIVVTGYWGWPEIPGFVRRACVDAVVEWLKNGQALSQQSPDQFEPGAPPARALPLSTRTALNSIRFPGIA